MPSLTFASQNPTFEDVVQLIHRLASGNRGTIGEAVYGVLGSVRFQYQGVFVSALYLLADKAPWLRLLPSSRKGVPVPLVEYIEGLEIDEEHSAGADNNFNVYMDLVQLVSTTLRDLGFPPDKS